MIIFVREGCALTKLSGAQRIKSFGSMMTIIMTTLLHKPTFSCLLTIQKINNLKSKLLGATKLIGITQA